MDGIHCRQQQTIHNKHVTPMLVGPVDGRHSVLLNGKGAKHRAQGAHTQVPRTTQCTGFGACKARLVTRRTRGGKVCSAVHLDHMRHSGCPGAHASKSLVLSHVHGFFSHAPLMMRVRRRLGCAIALLLSAFKVFISSLHY